MEYPIEIYHKKSHLIAFAVGLLLVSVVLSLLLYIVLTQPRYDLSEGFMNRKSLGPAMDLESIAAYTILAIGAILTSGLAFVILRLAYYGLPFIKINKQGVDVFIPIKLNYLRVYWKDITSVEFYEKRVRHSKIRAVNLILKDTKIFKKGAIIDREKSPSHLSDATYQLFQSKVSLNYSGLGIGFTHQEYFEFIKSEFLKYQANPDNFRARSGRLFGRSGKTA